jgi:hypothetical protein
MCTLAIDHLVRVAATQYADIRVTVVQVQVQVQVRVRKAVTHGAQIGIQKLRKLVPGSGESERWKL